MIKKRIQGQTALILILLSAAALIFLSITLNWGRIAQTKTMLSIAADQAAAMLASDAASYGEMEKQTNLQDSNEISALSGIIMDLIMVIVAIIILVITICSMGAGAVLFFAIVAVIAAIGTLVLQLTVVQPGMCALWNKLQKSQPIQQQFYEEGVGAALQGAISDQVNIGDYFDENTNGLYGNSSTGVANDTVGRFSFFYTERLKMLNKGVVPQVGFFYNQLMDFMNGETCYQNFINASNSVGKPTGTASLTGIPLNPSCIDPSTGADYCDADTSDPNCQMPIPSFVTCTQNVYENKNLSIPLDPSCAVCYSTPTDPSCQTEVPNVSAFRLNDQCTDSDPSSSSYNPYCDPCCQPLVVYYPANPSANPPTAATYKSLRPTSCFPYTTGYPTSCYAHPTQPNNVCYLTLGDSSEPSCVSDPNNSSCVPAQCSTNNPYNSDGQYPYIYDASYQEYKNGISFLDQFGRDQQYVSTGSTELLTQMDVEGNFPNGIYPFFWLMTDYSPEVDNINPNHPSVLLTSQDHWCNPSITPSYTPPPGFMSLAQLGTIYTSPTGVTTDFTLPYQCQGSNCCINFLMDALPSTSSSGVSTPFKLIVGTGSTVIKIDLVCPGAHCPGNTSTTFHVGDWFDINGNVTEPAPGTFTDIEFNLNSATSGNHWLDNVYFNFTPPFNPLVTPSAGNTVTFQSMSGFQVPSGCTAGGAAQPASATYSLIVSATDSDGNTASTGTNDPVTITIKNDNACASGDDCGFDECGNPCTTAGSKGNDGAGNCTGNWVCTIPAAETPPQYAPPSTLAGKNKPGKCTCTATAPYTCSGNDCGTDWCGKTCGANGGNCPPSGAPKKTTCPSADYPTTTTQEPGQCVCVASPACPSASYDCGKDSCGISCGTCPPSGQGTLTQCSTGGSSPGNCQIPGGIGYTSPSPNTLDESSPASGPNGSTTANTPAPAANGTNQARASATNAITPTVTSSQGSAASPAAESPSMSALAGTPTATLTVSDNGTVLTSPDTLPLNETLTLAATITNANQVEFYSEPMTGSGTTAHPYTCGTGQTYLGIATSSPYQITWQPKTGKYCIIAQASLGSASQPTTKNGVIDEVGNLTLPGLAYPSNPAADTSFGEPGCTAPDCWMPADNQMCLQTWPYNGKTGYLPDGSCEWNPTVTPSPSSPPAFSATESSVDGLDDTMHTLSGFSKFAQSLLNKDLGTINSTFDTWYSQAAAWIAPACGATHSTCTDTDFSSQDCACNPWACGATPADPTCNEGQCGRLLSIYNQSGNSCPAVDQLKSWSTVITDWLSNNYTSSNAWCVPSYSSLGTTTTEYKYIVDNASTSTWVICPMLSPA